MGLARSAERHVSLDDAIHRDPVRRQRHRVRRRFRNQHRQSRPSRQGLAETARPSRRSPMPNWVTETQMSETSPDSETWCIVPPAPAMGARTALAHSRALVTRPSRIGGSATPVTESEGSAAEPLVEIFDSYRSAGRIACRAPHRRCANGGGTARRSRDRGRRNGRRRTTRTSRCLRRSAAPRRRVRAPLRASASRRADRTRFAPSPSWVQARWSSRWPIQM